MQATKTMLTLTVLIEDLSLLRLPTRRYAKCKTL